MTSDIVLTFSNSGQSVRFSEPFTIGRDPECDLSVESAHVSRIHVSVSINDGDWWVTDLESTNGIFLDGIQVESAPLAQNSVLQVGRGGPEFVVSLPSQSDGGRQAASGLSETSKATALAPTWTSRRAIPPTPEPVDETHTMAGTMAGTESPDPGSIDQTIRRYFEEGDGGGEHTRLIRSAYSQVRKRDRRPLWIGLGAVGAALVLAGGWLVLQQGRLRDLESRAEGLFVSMRQTDVLVTNFRRALEESTGDGFQAQLAELEQQRIRQRQQYDGYVEQLGFYRRVKTDQERAIYRMARVFGESEFSMSGDFVRAVEGQIRSYWLGPGRQRLLEAIERGEQNGATDLIAQALEAHGLPLEFFYLAVQESDLKPQAAGPLTRFGRAKGMWQFIPVTAARYGLDPGPRPNGNAPHPRDERLDYPLATDAAARYLRDIYAELAQASGLLVMAAYNWGEHRVNPRLQSLESPDEAFKAEFADVAQTPEDRNYWRFLEQYGTRMPDETKDYVLKIFSAAVLASNPLLFGLDAEDPLARYRVELSG